MERDAPASAPLLDRMLGRGSAESLRGAGRALFGGGAPAPAPRKVSAPPRTATPRMRVVGAEEEETVRGRKGLGRAALALMLAAGTVAAVKPWRRLGTLGTDWTALFHVEAAAPTEDAAVEKAKAQALEDARLAALPLEAGTGRPLALWQDGSGRWWRVDGSAVLAPCPGPAAAEDLGLPEIHGVGAHAEAWGHGRRLVLDADPALLAGLLPLRGTVASEIRWVDLSTPGAPVLVTLDGARCLLGDKDWDRRQARLSLVLADLAARRRRASSVDLRFDGQAVVRPL